ncbi:hypothetical protein ACN20G_14460 [Streptomyces sp. BI20]|uniref:hypothetical protein n=1 Tax=Streptomyces sp. BI20 TaxID=3403460 RepID=UPI003C745FFD
MSTLKAMERAGMLESYVHPETGKRHYFLSAKGYDAARKGEAKTETRERAAKTTQDEIAEWYAGVLDNFGPYIPDANAKRKILTQRNEWNAIATAPRAKQTSGVIAVQWDEMVYALAYAESFRAPGWNPEWEPGFVADFVTEGEFTFGPFTPGGLAKAWQEIKARGRHPEDGWGPLGDAIRQQDCDANGEPTREGFLRIASQLNELFNLTQEERP